MGVSVDTVDRWLKELVREGLIRRERRGPGRPAECVFLSHPVLADSATLRNQKKVIPQPTDADTAHLPNADSATAAPPCKEENIHQEDIHENIHSSSSASNDAVAHVTLATGPVDDDETSCYETTENRVKEALLGFFDGTGLAMPSGTIPAAEINQVLREIGGGMADLLEFLKTYKARLKSPPATWRHVLVAVKRWAADPKIRDAIRARIEWRIADEQRRAEEAARQRTLATPAPVEDVLRLFRTHGTECAVPWPLQARLSRLGQTISPNELERQSVEWRRCRQCKDSGMIGTAIDQNLQFCGCAAGEEAPHRYGADWPTREIERVHAGPKALLVEALRSVRLDFAADAISESTVSDNGEVLEIEPSPEWAKFVIEPDIQKGLERIGWARTVRIGGTATPAPVNGEKREPGLPGQRTVICSETCRMCNGRVIIFSDGTGQECECRNRTRGETT